MNASEEDLKTLKPSVKYQSGFGNCHSSEALPNALPVGANNPQVCPKGNFSYTHNFHQPIILNIFFLLEIRPVQ